jgi:hypothetical protein
MTQPVAATNHPDGTRTYAVPHQSTGEIFDLPNITGIIGLADPKHICEWKLKMALLGAALRDDIAAQIAAANLLPAGPPRNGELRRVAELAMTAGQIIEKAHLPSDRGTALHSLTERLDDLVPAGAVALVDELGLPKRFADIAREYVAAMAGVRILHTEVTVASFTHGYAGTGDRIVGFEALDAWASAFDQWDLGRGCFFLDAKFGKVHDEAALQLAALANAETIWDAEAGTHTPLPDDLRRDVGFIFNPDKGLIPVPLDGAHEAFLGLVALKRWQDRGDEADAGRQTRCRRIDMMGASTPKRARPHRRRSLWWPRIPSTSPATEPVHISEALPKVMRGHPRDRRPHSRCPRSSEPAFAGLPDDDGKPQADRVAKRAWLIERIEALRTDRQGGVEQLAANCGPPACRRSSSRPSTPIDQLDLIAKAISAAEARGAAPLRDDDPTDPANIIVAPDDPRIADLIERGQAAPAGPAGGRRRRGDQQGRAQARRAPAHHRGAPRHRRADHGSRRDGVHAPGQADQRGVRAGGGVRHQRGGHLRRPRRGVAPAHPRRHPQPARPHRGGHLPARPDPRRARRRARRRPAGARARRPRRRAGRVLKAGREAARANGIEIPKDSDAVLAHPILAAALAVV